MHHKIKGIENIYIPPRAQLLNVFWNLAEPSAMSFGSFPSMYCCPAVLQQLPPSLQKPLSYFHPTTNPGFLALLLNSTSQDSQLCRGGGWRNLRFSAEPTLSFVLSKLLSTAEKAPDNSNRLSANSLAPLSESAAKTKLSQKAAIEPKLIIYKARSKEENDLLGAPGGSSVDPKSNTGKFSSDIHETLLMLLDLKVVLFHFIQDLTLSASSPTSRCCKVHVRLLFSCCFSYLPFNK